MSLLRTTIGLYLRQCGGWMPAKSLTDLMEVLDVPVELTRTALTRLKQKGVLTAEVNAGQKGYALTDAAELMFFRGDRRINFPRNMRPDDAWCLISFSLPESQRERRHQLRRHLSWIGCGTVAPGLWICPDFLREEVKVILQELSLQHHAVLFTTQTPEVAGDLRATVNEWWDLEYLAELHKEFAAEYGAVETGSVPSNAETFATYVKCVDRWRVIPYVDPGLPKSCLPDDWPGGRCTVLFQDIRNSHELPSLEFVRSLLPVSLTKE
ncbi:PaaX family transcriptional regulator C-terminal domain-containing protein [Arthrobacter sp. GMC3]|uniref:PaaX family transcriptional regulator n=1 Tax=Arthrobacter sp. GMC3 TaxID=2058894 RepID=UPI002157267B|nr:PaaX family transcriptional regulator C-terminal domain-containing protein [Arthrobacter sp. GMC3]